VLWQQRWLAVAAAGCCCELLRTHEHLLLALCCWAGCSGW
jgi:hypothetical protein